jgi:CheY-like chemotaxis protein
MPVILVVDDAPALLRIIHTILASQGYEVVAAASAEEALGVLRSQRIHLLLSDAYLPGGIGGVELIEEGRGLNPELKCILMSGALEQGSEYGLSYPTLSKPFAPEELLQLVDELLGGGAPAVS